MAILENIAGMKACPNCKKSTPPFNWVIETRATLREQDDKLEVADSATFITCKNCKYTIKL